MASQKGWQSGGWVGGLQGIVLLTATGFLLYQSFSSLLLAFNQSLGVGFRSLAAIILPLLIVTYLGFLYRNRSPAKVSQKEKVSQKARASTIASFVSFLLWTMFLLAVDASSQLPRFPLEELLYSITIAIMIWRFKRQGSFKVLLACCYGIISGALATAILFGINPAIL